MTSKLDVLMVLFDSGQIHHAPGSGRQLVLNKDGKKVNFALDAQTFLDLQIDGLIELARIIRHGHTIFRGRVHIYKISEKGKQAFGET